MAKRFSDFGPLQAHVQFGIYKGGFIAIGESSVILLTLSLLPY